MNHSDAVPADRGNDLCCFIVQILPDERLPG